MGKRAYPTEKFYWCFPLCAVGTLNFDDKAGEYEQSGEGLGAGDAGKICDFVEEGPGDVSKGATPSSVDPV